MRSGIGAGAIEIRIEGVQQALKGLKKYYNPERKKLLRKALNEAAKYLLQLARRFIPVTKGSGTLKRSLAKKTKYYGKSDTLVVVIGPRSWFFGKGPFGETQIAHKYAHLLEGGRRAINIKDMKRANQKPTFNNKGARILRIRMNNGRWVTFTDFVPAARPKPFLGKALKVGANRALSIMRQVVADGFN